MHAVTVPTTLAQAPVDVILVARTGTAAGIRVERLNLLGAMPRVREGFALTAKVAISSRRQAPTRASGRIHRKPSRARVSVALASRMDRLGLVPIGV